MTNPLDEIAEQKRSRRHELNKQNAERRKAAEDALVAQYPSPDLKGKEVQYFHDKYHGRTYAFVAPDGDELRAAAMKLLGDGKELAVKLMVGVSKVNKDEGDQYNKRVGRAVSRSKLSTITMKLHSASLSEGHQTFTLTLDKLTVWMTIQKNPNVPYVNYVQDQGVKLRNKNG